MCEAAYGGDTLKQEGEECGDDGELSRTARNDLSQKGKVIFIVITTQALLNFQLRNKFYHRGELTKILCQ